MRVIVTGGGSGGHITPVLAVAAELKKLDQHVEVEYVIQTGDALADVPAQDPHIDHVYGIRAGKFRRYHGEGLKQLLDLPTMYKNVRDAMFVCIGFWQSLWLLRRLRPDVIFIKGGYVGVPVGLAAAFLRIPYVTHDSDAMPGLANRIIARWARLHAVALPKEVYKYAQNKTVTVGVPISARFHPVSAEARAQTCRRLQIPPEGPVVVITGGGLGARRINNAVLACASQLFARYPDLQLLHIAGRQEESAVRTAYRQELSPKFRDHVVVKGFVANLYDYSAVASVVVTRAGGTTMAEMAAQAKACVVVPAPHLAGGHQLKNAHILAQRKAICVVDESTLADDPLALMPALTNLLDNPAKLASLGKKLSQLAQPDAAHRLAVLLLKVATTSSGPKKT